MTEPRWSAAFSYCHAHLKTFWAGGSVGTVLSVKLKAKDFLSSVFKTYNRKIVLRKQKEKEQLPRDRTVR